MKYRRSSAGFTLIELVVAMSIFAILAAAGWKVFDGLMKTRERATIQAKQLMNVQAVYAQLNRDISQAIARSVRQADQQKAALLTDGQSLELTRTGVIDPRLTGQGPLERVRYELRNNELWRLSYTQPDHTGALQPTATRLIGQVSQFKIQAFAPEAQPIWPPTDSLEANPSQGTDTQALNRLPKGIEVTLSVAEQPYVWVFALVPQLPSGAYDAGQQQEKDPNQPPERPPT
jgi:general secretion pathway protein J